MTWMLTATGNEVDLQHPLIGSINLQTIAHHLAQINRYCGAAVRPLSVAEHSLLVCEIAEREFGLDCHGLMAALMHDAHEAYTQDLSTPAKGVVGPGWRTFEHRMERMVRNAFGLHTASHANAAFIGQADLMALATERAQLLPPGRPWDVLAHVQPVPWVDLLERGRCSFTWLDWRQAFSDRANELDFARMERALSIPRSTSLPHHPI